MINMPEASKVSPEIPRGRGQTVVDLGKELLDRVKRPAQAVLLMGMLAACKEGGTTTTARAPYLNDPGSTWRASYGQICIVPESIVIDGKAYQLPPDAESIRAQGKNPVLVLTIPPGDHTLQIPPENSLPVECLRYDDTNSRDTAILQLDNQLEQGGSVPYNLTVTSTSK